MKERLENLEQNIGVEFRRQRLLEQALTHSSSVQENREANNERQEFLGDAILGMIVSEYLYKKFPGWSEGELTRAKAVLVSEPTLTEAARGIQLGKFLRLSKGEEQCGGAERPSILSGAFEALVAAIYLDSGMEKTRKFILRCLAEPLEAVATGEYNRDYKTLLQELAQGRHRSLPVYRTIDESGPDHDKTFVVEVCLDNRVIGVGSGKSKKDAERAAAEDALAAIEKKQTRRKRK